jgi:FMN-dependent oxidoreductase (nitrilotriacetate monooxygenase family)
VRVLKGVWAARKNGHGNFVSVPIAFLTCCVRHPFAVAAKCRQVRKRPPAAWIGDDMTKRQMKLGFILEGPGRSFGDWRHPDADPASAYRFPFFLEQARTAERGKFDFVFLADLVYTSREALPYHQSRLEPVTCMGALAATTSRVGLAATMSSTFTAPYNVARYFASLDHMSGGRSAWNLVTSYTDGSGPNFGLDGIPEHDLRYEMADEHLDIVRQLWDCWDDDAVANGQGKASFDRRKLRALDIRGEFYQIDGAFDLPRSPQGQPIIFQAGGSPKGRDFAARQADCLFVNPFSLAEGQAYHRDMMARVQKAGRDPSQVHTIVAMTPFIGKTREEAEAKYAQRVGLVDMKLALSHMSKLFDYKEDMSKYPVNEPLPGGLIEKYFNGYQSGLVQMAELVERKMSLGQIAQYIATPKSIFLGTAQELADIMQQWFEEDAADGFMVADGVPGQFTQFVDEVVPLLQQRGIFREEYEGSTLRENLGIRFPQRARPAPARASAGSINADAAAYRATT